MAIVSSPKGEGGQRRQNTHVAYFLDKMTP